MLAAQKPGKDIDVFGVGITAHKTHTSDVVGIEPDKTVELHGRERGADVLPQVLTMAARAATRTVGEVDGEGDLVGYLLEDHPRIHIFQHKRTLIF